MYKLSVTILKALLFYAVFGVVSAPLATAQQELSIQSEAMQETREIVVHLPKNYDENLEEGYPVIYMLDAGPKDKMTAALINYYNWLEVMPEAIVVGLKNIRRGLDFLPGYYSVEREGKQMSGNGTKLLAYISNELIPFVGQQFKTNDRKVFVGHSWGGQFAAYALSQSPDVFDAYFITSPDFGRWSPKTFDALKQTFKQDQSFPDFIYLSVGGAEEKSLLADYYRLAALLKQYMPEQVELYHEVHDSAVHMSNGAVSIPKALQLYFVADPST